MYLYFRAMRICVAPIGCFVVGCTTTPLPASDPNPPLVTWTVQQVGSNVVQTFGPSAGPIPIVYGQKYNIGFQADNPGGVKQMTLDGTGMFNCASQPSSTGSNGVWPFKLPASLPHQQADFTPDSQNLVETRESLVMPSFDNSSLSCGHHGPTNDEFFAIGGALTLQGTASNYYGKTATGQLQLTSP